PLYVPLCKRMLCSSQILFRFPQFLCDQVHGRPGCGQSFPAAGTVQTDISLLLLDQDLSRKNPLVESRIGRLQGPKLSGREDERRCLAVESGLDHGDALCCSPCIICLDEEIDITLVDIV